MKEKVQYELECDGCGVEFELAYIEEKNSDVPMYCPFCGCDIDLEGIEEIDDESDVFDDDVEIDELDFEDDRY